MQKARKAGRSGILFLLMLFVLTFAIGTTSVEAATVKLNKTSATVYVGKTVTLKVSGTTKTVTWSSSNKKVATVSSKGKVTAVKAGTATIKAKVGGKTYSCKVTVKSPYLSKTSATLIKGQSTTLTLTGATMKSASSSKKSVATVTSKGKITAKKSGTTTITIKDTKGNKYTCKVTVKVGSLSSSSTSLIKGDAKTLTLSSVDIKSVKSSKTSVATVSKTSSRKLKITAKASGTATITVTDKYGNTYKCKVTVKLGTLSASTASINVGSTKTLAISGVTVKSVKSSKTSVATVSKTSSTKVKITAKKAGTATITVTDQYGNTYKCTVTVKNVAVTSVSMSKSSLTLDIGGTSTLTVTVSPSNATNKSVTWTSSNTSVATVSSAGKVTAVSAGTATITATAADGSGKKATCKVTVNPQLVTEITLSESTATLEIGGTTQLTATVFPSDAANKNVTWSSSDTSVATVDSTGEVTAVGAGTAIITVTAEDGSGISASCEVTVMDTSGTPLELDVAQEIYLLDDEQTMKYTYTPTETGFYQFTMDSGHGGMDECGFALYGNGTYLSPAKYLSSSEDDDIIKIYLIYQLEAGVHYTFRISSMYSFTCTILIEEFDFGLFDVVGTGINSYTADYYIDSGALYIYGYEDSCPSFTVTAKEGVTSDFKTNDDGDMTLTLTYGEDTYTYYVYYCFDTSIFAIYEVSADTEISDWYTAKNEWGNWLTVYGYATSCPELTLTVDDGVTYKFETDYNDNMILTLTYNGHTCKYYVYYYTDTSIYDISILSEGYIKRTSCTRYNSYGELYLYGYESTCPDLTPIVNSGVTYEFGTSDDGDMILTLTYGKSTYVYYIYYYIDTGVYSINSLSSDAEIEDWDTNQGDSYGYLYVYGYEPTCPELTLTVNDGVTYEFGTNDDGDRILTMTFGDSTYYYYVYYYVDSDIYSINSLTSDGDIKEWYTDQYENYGRLYVFGYGATCPTLTLTVNDGVTYEFETNEYGDIILNMNYGEATYFYYVDYSFDKSIYYISSLSSEESMILSWDADRYNSCGYLYIYGEKETLPELTIEVNDGVTYEITEDAELILTYKSSTYTYYILYSYIPMTEISLDEEVTVSLTGENPVVCFVFTPEKTGTYTFTSYDDSDLDPYVFLYQNGTMIAENDDGGDDMNFSLSVTLEAGVQYVFWAADYESDDGDDTSYIAKLVFEE